MCPGHLNFKQTELIWIETVVSEWFNQEKLGALFRKKYDSWAPGQICWKPDSITSVTKDITFIFSPKEMFLACNNFFLACPKLINVLSCNLPSPLIGSQGIEDANNPVSSNMLYTGSVYDKFHVTTSNECEWNHMPTADKMRREEKNKKKIQDFNVHRLSNTSVKRYRPAYIRWHTRLGEGHIVSFYVPSPVKR